MRKDIIVHESPKSPVSEAVRLLRTNLTFLCKNSKNQVFLFTSAAPGDGKSWTSANLAIAYAQSDKKVLIIDADLRKGRLHKIFGKLNKKGLSDYLLAVSNIDDLKEQTSVLQNVILKTEVPNLHMMTSGTVPPNPSELLSTDRIDDMLEIVKQNYDVIIFDMPPVSIVTDSLVICKKVDYTVLVAAAERTKRDVILNAKKSIEQVGGKIAGVVLNRVPMEKRKEYTKYYSHYSSDNAPTLRSEASGVKPRRNSKNS